MIFTISYKLHKSEQECNQVIFMDSFFINKWHQYDYITVFSDYHLNLPLSINNINKQHVSSLELQLCGT